MIHAFAKSSRKLIDRAEGFRCVGTYGDAETALSEIPAHKPDVVFDGHQSARNVRH